MNGVSRRLTEHPIPDVRCVFACSGTTQTVGVRVDAREGGGRHGGERHGVRRVFRVDALGGVGRHVGVRRFPRGIA